MKFRLPGIVSKVLLCSFLSAGCFYCGQYVRSLRGERDVVPIVISESEADNKGNSIAGGDVEPTELNALDFQALCMNLIQQRESSELKVTMARWAESDPDAALSFIRGLEIEPTTRSELVALLFNAWARLDLNVALSAAEETGSDKALAIESISDSLRYLEPQKAAGINFKELADKEAFNTFWQLAIEDPETLQDRILEGDFQSMSVSVRTKILEKIAISKLQSDPEAAIQWARSLTLPTARWQCISTIVNKMALLDPEKALACLRSIPGWRHQDNAIYAIAEAWHETDSEEALRWLRGNVTSKSQKQRFQKLLNRTMASDPAIAAKMAVESGERNISRIAGRYGRTNRGEALAWLGRIPETAKVRRESVAEEIASGWMAVDPAGARRALGTIEDTQTAKGFAKGIARSLGEQNPVSAMRWARSLPSDTYGNILPSLLSGYARYNPIEASQFVFEIEEQSLADEAAGMVAREWAASYPQSAANWAATIEQTSAQTSAVGQTVKKWARTDPDAAAEWVGTFPRGATKDRSSAEIANAIVVVDPEAAFYWAAAIEDPSKQWKTLPSIVASWAVRDASAAVNAVDNSEFLPQQREALKQLVGNVAP